MIIVGAMTTDRIIGSGDGMPWDVPEEYAHFQRLVDGHTIIIGRRSYEIFGGSLTSAHNVVVSRSAGDGGDLADIASRGAIVVRTIEDALRTAQSFGGGTVFSAGGRGRSTRKPSRLPDTMYLLFIKGRFTGDARFPEFSEQEWAVEKREDHPRFEFVVYRRRPG